MRLLGASGQLGYGIPAAAFNAGIERRPDLIGCDMGSIDIGPTYLGKGEMATSPEATRRDLRRVLHRRPRAGRAAGDRLGRVGRRRAASGRDPGDDPRHRARPMGCAFAWRSCGPTFRARCCWRPFAPAE